MVETYQQDSVPNYVADASGTVSILVDASSFSILVARRRADLSPCGTLVPQFVRRRSRLCARSDYETLSSSFAPLGHPGGTGVCHLAALGKTAAGTLLPA